MTNGNPFVTYTSLIPPRVRKDFLSATRKMTNFYMSLAGSTPCFF